jgi:peptide/nickel transport system substrate-binding protein
VKRVTLKSVPDEATRMVMVKRGESDISYGLRGPDADDVRRTPGLTLKVVLPTVSQWLVFTQQWDPKSPWADQRVRLAANLGIDRKTFSDAEYLGHGRPAPSIIPRDFEFYWTPPAYPYDPARAKKLLAEAGYPKGFDAVELATDAVFAPEAEAVLNGLQSIGIRSRLRPMERASFYKADQEKQFKYLVRVGSGAAGNAATRIEAFVISGGIRSYGGYPDIDSLFRDQAGEMDGKRREALLHRIQQLMHERAMFAPIVEQAGLIGVGPRLAEVPTITGHPFISPYEDLKLK